MEGLLIVLITGFLIYKLITSPIKAFQFMLKGTFIFVLGCAVWLGFVFLLLYTL